MLHILYIFGKEISPFGTAGVDHIHTRLEAKILGAFVFVHRRYIHTLGIGSPPGARIGNPQFATFALPRSSPDYVLSKY